MSLAVLAERAACEAIERDVFDNVSGGLKVSEPAIDLGVACAIASEAWRAPLDEGTVVFGKVGLAHRRRDRLGPRRAGTGVEFASSCRAKETS